MAFTKEFKDFLTGLGVEADKLQEAITSDEEVEVTHNSGTLISDEKLDDLKTKVKSEGYNDGKVAGVEMAIKSAKEKYGLNFEGKSIDVFAESYKKQVLEEVKAPTDKKVTELTESLEKLQGTYTKDLGDKDTEISGLKGSLNKLKTNGELMQHIPANLKGVKPNQLVQLARTEIEFDYDDGVLVGKKNGKTMKDNMENSIPVADILSDYAKKNDWISIKGRKGEHEFSGEDGEFKSMHDVQKYMDDNKINPMSEEGQSIVDKFNKNQD